MNIFTYLKRDHETVAELFDKILSTRSSDKRKAIFDEVAKELLIHIQAESSTFYEALRAFEEAAELIGHAEKEHTEVKDYITKIYKISIESEKWIEQFGELKHSVTHHVEEEEGDIFEMAKRVLSNEQATQLALDMRTLKEELKAA
ncbi:MAG: hemerythrin domain-containing protein [Alphaproteobacteria bacterium]|jgi:hemerythrin superfamily protein|nr:hemerythrin domain-containing protein [Alphaproteobacteria bacterium]